LQGKGGAGLERQFRGELVESRWGEALGKLQASHLAGDFLVGAVLRRG
jgi:hypothetical protein